MNSDFQTMPLEELRQYVLTHRTEDEPFSIYTSRLQASNISRQTINISTSEGEAEFKKYLDSRTK